MGKPDFEPGEFSDLNTSFTPEVTMMVQNLLGIDETPPAEVIRPKRKTWQVNQAMRDEFILRNNAGHWTKTQIDSALRAERDSQRISRNIWSK